ncbi:MAG: sigma 54-interacting transcriptional regulator [Desulfobacterales bacterium]|jgi:transcriptional regulator with GAF, ATPase, and Fis domain/tetratricopeptide (TPR) repeat protein|nr:sigma 54-interacting transcriptional regulator [Desulfobacterales bacterium]
MISDLPDFSPVQWDFLSVLEAFASPLPIDIVGTLVPLTAVSLFDLMERAAQLNILETTSGHVFALSSKLPSIITEKLQAINTPLRISEMIDALTISNLLDRLDPEIIAKLLLKAQREEDAVTIQSSLAEKAVLSQDVNTAIVFLRQALEGRHLRNRNYSIDTQLVSLVLKVSDLCFANGKGFPEALSLLQKTCFICEATGDKRSRAMIDMHMGMHFYLFNMFDESLKALSAGKQAAEAFGDNDILNYAAGYVGLYYLIQGDYKEALAYFETAVEQNRLPGNDDINPFAPVFFSLSAMAFYQFDRAFTILDVFHRKAEQNNRSGAAALLRAVLGYILMNHQKEKEALYHLSIAQNAAGEQCNAFALCWVKLFMTYHQFMMGNLPEARNAFINATDNAAKANLGLPVATFPWILDMLLEFERQNIAPVPNCSLTNAIDIIMNGPSASTKGLAMRILAKRAVLNKLPVGQIYSYLQNSLKYLEHTGFMVELSKTRIEMARLELSKGNRDHARDYAQDAWRDLPGYAEHVFPDDLQHLIENVSKGWILKSFMSPEVVFNRFSTILEKVVPASDLKVLLRRVVTATNWFFSAERGGFFLFEGDVKKAKAILLGAVNLTEIETASLNFNTSMNLMIQAIQNDRPLIKKIAMAGHSKMIPVLCIPVNPGEGRHGVLYHDNAVLSDCFDFLDDHALNLLKIHLNGLCRQIWEYCRSAQRNKNLLSEEIIEQGAVLNKSIIGQSPVFQEVLKKARRIAGSDSPILIQGETGAGKEVMARWVHKHSPRRNSPYVIIDSTTIAENLIESELFGHEKGAFTGADRQKPGRVELASGGTLFLDEVGELPLSIQAKLLRVLEEKTFTRVGGSRVHQCDFRLIAATNRNLAAEVKTGRFRQDLFYRLNVLPIEIPPLRERKEDIVLLARHFLELACKRLKRSQPPITPADVSALLAYPWPGNIRELKNIIERASLLSSDHRLELQLTVAPESRQASAFEDMPTMSELQRRYIAHVLKATGRQIGGPNGAANVLGMNRCTLYSRMKKLGMSLDDESDINLSALPL